MMMYFQRAHDVRMRILSWLLVIHWGGGGGGAMITPGGIPRGGHSLLWHVPLNRTGMIFIVSSLKQGI